MDPQHAAFLERFTTAAAPDDPAVDVEWAYYETHMYKQPWPPPTLRLRFRAMDDYVLYEIAKLEGYLDDGLLPAKNMRLEVEEFRSWVDKCHFGARRYAWWNQLRVLWGLQRKLVEDLPPDVNPYARNEVKWDPRWESRRIQVNVPLINYVADLPEGQLPDPAIVAQLTSTPLPTVADLMRPLFTTTTADHCM